jgi:hypothetical protein
MNNSKLTCVSGYWAVKNKHDIKYNNWFKNTLKINCPYAFFGDKESIKLAKKYRKELPTYYIEFDIEEFTTYKYKNKMITDATHCPSVELNLIWNEKIFMIERASKINPFSSDFFAWVDAGICNYRTEPPPSVPFPNIGKLNNLPKDKLIYSSSKDYIEQEVKRDNYYQHIAGTSFVIHKNMINKFAVLYKQYLDKLVDRNNIWTDQVLWTHIYKDNKDLFFEYARGYGAACTNLF